MKYNREKCEIRIKNALKYSNEKKLKSTNKFNDLKILQQL